MDRSKVFLLMVVFFLGASLSSCNLDDSLPACDPAVIHIIGATPNYRNPVLDLTSWTIEWAYYIEDEDGRQVDAACDPEVQHIRIGTRSFTESGAVVRTPLLEDDLLPADRTYIPDLDLEPGGHYYFEIIWSAGEYPYSGTVAFNTGPICDRTQLLPPLILSLPDGAVVESDAIISWMFQSACTPESIEVQLSSSPDFTALDTEVYNYSIAFHGMAGWDTCRWYYWRVATAMTVAPTDIRFVPDVELPIPLAGEPLPYEFSGYLRSEFTPVRSFYVIGEGCLLPPDSLVPTLPPEVREPPRFRPAAEANCRSGPSLDYPVRSVLLAGSEYEIQGRNQAGDSWLVLDPAIGGTCWVYGGLGEQLGDAGLVMTIDPPPPPLVLPTDTPTLVFNCAQYNADQKACSSQSACKWDPNGSPNSPCVNK